MARAVRSVISGLLAACLVLWVAPAAGAAAPAPAPAWPVKGVILGKPNAVDDPTGAVSQDVSGLACAPQAAGRRTCLIVDDEGQGAQIVILDGESLIAGDFIPLITDAFDGKPVELDAEAVAYADGLFYVAGSQGRPRNELKARNPAKERAKTDHKAAASRRLFRLDLRAAGLDPLTGRLARPAAVIRTASDRLTALIQAAPALKAAFDVPLDDGGLTVEGVAVLGDALVVGFRGPVPDGQAVLLSAPLRTLFDGGTAAATVLRVDLGRDRAGHPRGVRDLTVDGGQILGIAGPVLDPDKATPVRCGDYALFAWRPGAAARVQPLPAYGPKGDKAKPFKPEGLTPLAAGRALLTFDGAPSGRPTPIVIDFAAPSVCGRS